MADTELEKPGEEEELIIVDTPIVGDPKGDDDDHEADGDKRLAAEAGDDDADDEEQERAKKRDKRRTYRERRKAAENRTKDENHQLREILSVVTTRLNALEGNFAQSGEQGIEQRLAHMNGLVGQIDAAIAKAVDEGNGADVAAAMRDRDTVLEQKRALEGFKQHVAQTRVGSQPDPSIATYAQSFARENSDWFDPSYGNDESRRARAIDNALASEGWDPRTPAYWSELQRRCDALFEDEPEPKPRRTPPPTGRTREHVPPAVRANEVYVSPERKAALQELGVWDDTTKRNEYLKAYRDYDREQRETVR